MSIRTGALKRPFHVAFPHSATEFSDPVSEPDVIIKFSLAPEPLRFNDVLPSEIITKIFQFLSVASLVRCCSVCECWRDLIVIDQDLQKKISIAWVKKFIGTYLVNEKVFISLVRVEASIDQEGSQATIRKIHDADVQFEANLQFLKMKAKKDPEGARADAKSLKKQEHRYKALIEIEGIDPNIAETEGDETLETARLLSHKYLQCKAFLEIFEARIKVNPEKAKPVLRNAKTAALSIETPRSRCAYLLKVYHSQLKVDPEGAKTTLKETEVAAQFITDNYIQNQVMGEIRALDQAQTKTPIEPTQPNSEHKTNEELNDAVKNAEEKLQTAKNTFEQSKARLELMKIKIEKKDLVGARETAKDLSDPNDKDEAVEAIMGAFH